MPIALSGNPTEKEKGGEGNLSYQNGNQEKKEGKEGGNVQKLKDTNAPQENKSNKNKEVNSRNENRPRKRKLMKKGKLK